MQVRYTPTQKDVNTVTRLLTRGVLQVVQYINRAALLALVGFIVYCASRSSGQMEMEILAAIYAYVLLRLAIRLLSAKRISVTEPDSLGVETTAVIDPAGVTFASRRRRLQYTWDCFTGVELSKEYLLLPTSPYRAHYIPLRAFYDDRQLHDFVAQAQAYRDAAQYNAPLPLDAPAPAPASAAIPLAGSSAAAILPASESESAVWPPRPWMR